MLTKRTLKAISVLHSVSLMNKLTEVESGPESETVERILNCFELAGLVCHSDTNPSGYELTRSLLRISLLDVLEAIGEHLNCNNADCEHMYTQFPLIARHLGVVNQMTRFYLSRISINEI